MASAQTVSGPFIDSTEKFVDDRQRMMINTIIPAGIRNINGELIPEERSRSIFKIILYKRI
jgi:hypothetical protein